MDKNNIVVVMDTYYPDSRATTYIMQQILEQISNSYNIHVITLNLLKRADENSLPTKHNGINIYYAELPTLKPSLKHFFAKTISKLIIPFFRIKYKIDYQYDELYVLSKQVRQLINATKATVLISVSSPTDVHICAEMAIIRRKKYKWFAFSFDPHSHNNEYSNKFQRKLEHEELRLYKRTDAIFMLRQSEKDYKESPLYQKIIFFDIPIIEKSISTVKKKQDAGRIKIMYIGNLFYSIRNPEYMFDLFSRIDSFDYTLYVIGTFSGWNNNDLEAFKKKLSGVFGDKLVIIDRLSRDEIKNYLSNADFFVNLGNLTENQCPSKVIDYISTGKPIIHFQKIQNCASLLYLEKYPNVCIIDERDSLESNFLKFKQFIVSNSGKTVDESILKELYRENDIKYISNLLTSQIKFKL